MTQYPWISIICLHCLFIGAYLIVAPATSRPNWVISHDDTANERKSSATCTTDLDCSLNGVCNNGACVCDKPWIGPECALLDALPVSFPQGYGMTPNQTTWGGGILEENGLYHLYVVRMTNNCTLEHWTKNSRVDHAVSDKPTGPFRFLDVAIPVQSHNPVPVKLPDGRYAIFHIGAGTGDINGGADCNTITSSSGYSWEDDIDELEAAAAEGSTIHVSNSLYGPWRPLDHTLGNCNNPAPFVHPNGTIYVGCHNHVSVLRRAESIAGPYEEIATIPRVTNDGHTLEDPQLYVDHREHFHIIYHAYKTFPNASNCENDVVASHAFSVDGIDWKVSDTAPYGTELKLANGKSLTLATKERPKPLIQNGRMTHLVMSAVGVPNCYSPTGCVNCKYKNWDFTLVLPLNV